jgi:(2Fe-2S) ferredoxin
MGKKKPDRKAKELHLGSLRAHVLVCTAGKCAEKPEQSRSLKGIRKQLKAQGLTKRKGGVMCTATGCLQVCAGGPIAVVWPDGVWYRNATPENLDRILEEHIVGGEVVKDLRIAGPKKTRAS